MIIKIGITAVILRRKNECNLCSNLFFLNHQDKYHKRKSGSKRMVNVQVLHFSAFFPKLDVFDIGNSAELILDYIVVAGTGL